MSGLHPERLVDDVLELLRTQLPPFLVDLGASLVPPEVVAPPKTWQSYESEGIGLLTPAIMVEPGPATELQRVDDDGAVLAVEMMQALNVIAVVTDQRGWDQARRLRSRYVAALRAVLMNAPEPSPGCFREPKSWRETLDAGLTGDAMSVLEVAVSLQYRCQIAIPNPDFTGRDIVEVDITVETLSSAP